MYVNPYPPAGSCVKSMTGELLKSAFGQPTTPDWLGSPTEHVVLSGQVRPDGSVKVVAVKGTARNASICRWAITSAVPSFRLLAFIIIEVGTSCATATRPTTTITVAISISTSVNPRSSPRQAAAVLICFG